MGLPPVWPRMKILLIAYHRETVMAPSNAWLTFFLISRASWDGQHLLLDRKPHPQVLAGTSSNKTYWLEPRKCKKPSGSRVEGLTLCVSGLSWDLSNTTLILQNFFPSQFPPCWQIYQLSLLLTSLAAILVARQAPVFHFAGQNSISLCGKMLSSRSSPLTLHAHLEQPWEHISWLSPDYKQTRIQLS